MSQFLQCPQCRGYNLERQWCDLCKGAGMIRNEAECAPSVVDVLTFADVLRERARTTQGESK